MKSSALGYCGLDCAGCPVFIASANNNVVLRKKNGEPWSTLFEEYLSKNAVNPEDMSCKGCRADNSHCIGLRCVNCPIKQCCQKKNFVTCASCSNYETCEMLNVFFSSHHQRAKDNLDRIRMYLLTG